MLPPYSTLIPFADFVDSYSLSADKAEFLESFDVADDLGSTMIRFAAFRALELGLDELAYKLFEAIPEKNLRDFLASTMAKIHLGEWIEAERILDQATRITWQFAERDDLVNLYKLLLQMRDNGTLEKIDENYLNRLSEQIGEDDSFDLAEVPDINSFCPQRQ